MKIDVAYLVLRRDATRLTLDPQRGGAIREFDWHGQAIFRPMPVMAGDDPFDMACFPMVPFVNRVAHGRFSFCGRAQSALPGALGRDAGEATVVAPGNRLAVQVEFAIGAA